MISSLRAYTPRPDPLTELSQLQRSVMALQNYYRAQRSHGNASPDPEAVAAHDMLLNSLDGDGYYVGATWEATPLMKYFKVSYPSTVFVYTISPLALGLRY